MIALTSSSFAIESLNEKKNSNSQDLHAVENVKSKATLHGVNCPFHSILVSSVAARVSKMKLGTSRLDTRVTLIFHERIKT